MIEYKHLKLYEESMRVISKFRLTLSASTMALTFGCTNTQPPNAIPAQNQSMDFYRLTPPTNLTSCPGFAPVPYSTIVINGMMPHPDPYPAEAKMKRISGIVVIQICVDSTGTPKSATAISGPEELRENATSYGMRFRFKPYLVSGVATNVTFFMMFPYRLS